MTLLDLQAVDSTLAGLDRKLESLPESARLKQLTAEQAVLTTATDRLRAEVGDLARDHRKAEADVEQVRTRRARNRQRIDDGQVGDPRQLQALQSEMQSLDRRISDLEDIQLDVMERLETASATLAEQEERLAALDAEIETTRAARDSAAGQLARLRADAAAEREQLAAQIPDDLRGLYDRLRGKSDGVGAARINRGRCEGCRLQIGAAELARIRSAPADEVLRCEECNRILVRTADSGL